jgi:hypothetical protein
LNRLKRTLSVFTEETEKEFVGDLLGSLSSLLDELRTKYAEAAVEAAILRISKFLDNFDFEDGVDSDGSSSVCLRD